MGIFNKFWELLTGVLGVLLGIFFIKSKIQENSIEAKDSEIEAKEKQIEAKEDEIKVVKKTYENKIKIKDFKNEVVTNEKKIEKNKSSRDDQLEKKVYETEDGKEYKVIL